MSTRGLFIICIGHRILNLGAIYPDCLFSDNFLGISGPLGEICFTRCDLGSTGKFVFLHTGLVAVLINLSV